MRRALIVGIDAYPGSPLTGCVNDAKRVTDLLSKNSDSSPNFECRLLTAPTEGITKAVLREQVELLFANEADVALFYFSGHGSENNLGGFLVTQDAKRYDEGMAMHDILTLANRSPVHEIVIILDCCHSGALGAVPAIDNEKAVLREGVSVLAASRASQSAIEQGGSGVFTSLICDALAGGASDVLGHITVASVYAYADQTLGSWEQRPLFKSHVSRLTSIRRGNPEVDLDILRLLPRYFPDPFQELPLDSSYEPTESPPHPEHEKIFGHLQKYRDARLLVPVGEDHMFFAAMRNKSCKLTPLGQFYWQLANSGKI